jgi:hypothetical protein
MKQNSTSDASRQSVKCQYSHQWAANAEGQVLCSKCGHFPTARQIERAEAIVRLREWVKAGDTLHTQLKSVSRSGMQRVIQVLKISCEEGKAEPSMSYLGYNVALATDSRYNRDREGVKVSGCGMDMGFSLVYDLARTLFPEGFECTGEGCPANDHSNDYTMKREKGAHHHNDGGYALKQRWI